MYLTNGKYANYWGGAREQSDTYAEEGNIDIFVFSFLHFKLFFIHFDDFAGRLKIRKMKK